MSKLIAVAAMVVVAGSLAYAEEKKAESATDEPAVAKAETPVDKKAQVRAAEETEAALEKLAAKDPEEVDWSKIDWRKRLTRLQYHIMREAGTERPFQNKFWDYFKPGEYRCAGCGLPLFEADAKFDSECGWPSFDRTIAKDTVTLHEDLKMLQPRTEIRCRRCEAHLGHVFDDGPTNTGLRYCMNSAAMKFMNVKQLEVEKKKTPNAKTKPSAATTPKSAESTETTPIATDAK